MENLKKKKIYVPYQFGGWNRIRKSFLCLQNLSNFLEKNRYARHVMHPCFEEEKKTFIK